jgi:ureidoglycolate lyase
LTAEAFAPFGEVIEVPDAAGQLINGGTSARFDDIARLDLTGNGGRPLLSLFRTQPCQLPFPISMLERHPLSSQAFIPLSDEPFLVVVAPLGDSLDPASIRAFRTHTRQGVNYGRGVWHHPLLAMGSTCDFVVIGRAAADPNCDIHHVARPITLVND